MNTCTIDGCQRQYLASGFCNMHYRRWKRHADPLYVRHQNICEVEDCKENVYGRGFCSKHWQRWKNHGDPLGHHQCQLSADIVREIRSKKGLEHQKTLAERFGVTRSAISSVQNGYTWAWLK